MGVQIAGPAVCIGIETSSTLAPRSPSRRAAAVTFSLTAFSPFGCLNPSVTSAIRIPLTPPPSMREYGWTLGALMRGS